MRLPTVVAVLLLSLVASGTPAPDAGTAGVIQWAGTESKWRPGPSGVPGSQQWILEGDPKRAGLFTLRLRLPPKFELLPHTHPQDERVTVVEGAVFVGLGERLDRAKGRRMPTGAFYVNPRGVPHSVWSDDGAVLQITGVGPWEVHPVEAGKTPE